MHVHFKVHGTGKKNLHGDGIALWYTRDRLVPGGEVHDQWHRHGVTVAHHSGGWTWRVACLGHSVAVGRLLLTWLWRGQESLRRGPLRPPDTVLTILPTYYF